VAWPVITETAGHSVGQLAQSGKQLAAIAAKHDRAVLKGRPSRQRPPNIGDFQLLTGTDGFGKPRGLCRQRRCTLG